LQPNDQTSWKNQAKIHKDLCQHGQYYFLVWHRLYLYWFERILRKASENPKLTLPYWNYSPESEAQRQLPLAFRERTDDESRPNPLFTPDRDPDMNNGGTLPSGTVSYNSVLCLPCFEGPKGTCFGGRFVHSKPDGKPNSTEAYGALEMMPHQGIHTYVGGSNGWMKDPDTAALDPIFWVHHANIDRLWERWLSVRGHENPTRREWLDQPFHFFDEEGKPVTSYPKEALRAADLGYGYGDGNWRAPDCKNTPPWEGEGTPKATPMTWLDSTKTTRPKVVLGNEPVSVKLSARNIKLPAEKVLDDVTKAGSKEKLVLSLQKLKLLPDNPEVDYEIYVNLQDGERPDFHSESYVGLLGFFGKGPGHGHVHGAPTKATDKTTTFDLTGTLVRLKEAHKLNSDTLKITIAPLELLPPPGDPQQPIPPKGGFQVRLIALKLALK
jgi:hypothetical protein